MQAKLLDHHRMFILNATERIKVVKVHGDENGGHKIIRPAAMLILKNSSMHCNASKSIKYMFPTTMIEN